MSYSLPLAAGALPALPARPALLLTHEVRGVVRAAAALVGCDLGIRAKRACAIDLPVTNSRRDDLIRRFLLFHPLLEGA